MNISAKVMFPLQDTPPEQPEPGVSTIQYARLMHDRQLAMYGYKSRFAEKTWPEPVPFSVAPKANAGKDNIALSQAWENFLVGINSADGYKHIRVGTAGWFNQDKNADTLSFGGNVIAVTLQGNWAKITSFNVNDGPPSAKDVNFDTSPHLVQKLVAMRPDGSITNPGNGKDAFLFIIKRKGDLFVPLDRIELFPTLPVDVTVTSLLRAFSSPSEKSAIVGSFSTGKQVRIYSYAPRGCSVWGQTSAGWIYLMRNIFPGRSEYYTSWTMATEPPIAPKVTV